MNNILQGVLLLIIGFLLLIYRVKYPNKGPDILASDFSLTIAIIAIFIVAISILVGWMHPVAL